MRQRTCVFVGLCLRLCLCLCVCIMRCIVDSTHKPAVSCRAARLVHCQRHRRGTQVNSHNDVINNRNRQLGIQTMVALTLTAADVREILGPVAMRVCLTPVLATSLMCKPPRYRTREEVT